MVFGFERPYLAMSLKLNLLQIGNSVKTADFSENSGFQLETVDLSWKMSLPSPYPFPSSNDLKSPDFRENERPLPGTVTS